MSGTGNGANPLIAQGALNRLRASVTVPTYPILNVTASYLAKAGIRLALEGETTTMIPTLTGTVISPQPYQMARVTMNLLMSQSLSNTYKSQMETASAIGTIMVTPVASTLGVYQIVNCAIQSIGELDFAGEEASFPITLQGYYNINSSLWSLT